MDSEECPLFIERTGWIGDRGWSRRGSIPTIGWLLCPSHGAMGLGYVFSEEIRFEGGKILDRNFGTYELARFSQMPEIETVFVSNDELAPKGGGEPAIINMGAVVANAIFDATGARVYRLPMTPERVLETMRSS